MDRRHYSPDHPSMRYQIDTLNMTVRERRMAVVERNKYRKKGDAVKTQGLLGMVMVMSSLFTFVNAETYGGGWWLVTGALLGGGGSLLANAIHRAN